MQIHTVRCGETVKDIAVEYGVSEDNIRANNGIPEGEVTEGEQLLILIPTRSYTARVGDSIDRISVRFGIRESDIIAMNPQLSGGKMKCGQTITLRSSERPYGMSVANGYFYNGCSEDRLKAMLPYLTYVTFASYAADERGIRRIFDDSAARDIATRADKIPLVRVYDSYGERYKDKAKRDSFADGLINIASNGYKGVVLNASARGECEGDFAEFIVEMRKRMMGLDLILLTEVDGESPIAFSDYADGSCISYPKYAQSEAKCFDEGERKVLADFACEGESAKAFVDLPALARLGDRYASIDEAIREARRTGAKIQNDEKTLLSSFGCRQGEWRYTSLENIKALLELVGEYDYSGVCFDIMRTPVSHVMMYNAMFKTSYHTSVRTPEGCSRGV